MNPLKMLPIVLAAPFVLHTGGCASNPSTPDDASASSSGGASSGGSSGGAPCDACDGGRSSSSSSSGGSGSSSGGSSSGRPGDGGVVDLCKGLVADTSTHPMTALTKPAKGASVVDPEFGTKITRITAVAVAGSDPVIKPMYSPVAAWNADESKLLLYNVGKGHELYDGKTYAFLESLDISPPDLEQVWWDGEDPDVFYYIDGIVFTRYHVASRAKDALHTFSFCGGGKQVAADSHAFTSWSGKGAVGLACCDAGDISSCSSSFVYEIAADRVTGPVSSTQGPPHMGADGKLVYWHGQVSGLDLAVTRTLDLDNPDEHSALGMLANGHDTYNSVIYDPGPKGSPVGVLVAFDMTDGTAHPIISQAQGYPYPPSAVHISPLVFRQPGWVWVSIVGETSGAGLLDQELVIADTNTGKVCRAAHHRSWGKNNTKLATSYWAEPHVTTSPSGTRAVFGSDWGNDASVDTYVVELPTYVP